VEINVYPESIDVVEANTHDIIKTVSIMEVTFTAFDPDDKRLFSYITNDSRLGLIYCHAFSVKAKVIPIFSSPTSMPLFLSFSLVVCLSLSRAL
jgi:hypothetical protein